MKVNLTFGLLGLLVCAASSAFGSSLSDEFDKQNAKEANERRVKKEVDDALKMIPNKAIVIDCFMLDNKSAPHEKFAFVNGFVFQNNDTPEFRGRYQKRGNLVTWKISSGNITFYYEFNTDTGIAYSKLVGLIKGGPAIEEIVKNQCSVITKNMASF